MACVADNLRLLYLIFFIFSSFSGALADYGRHITLSTVDEKWNYQDIENFKKNLGGLKEKHLVGFFEEYSTEPQTERVKLSMISTTDETHCVRSACLTQIIFQTGASVSHVFVYAGKDFRIFSDRLPNTDKSIGIIEFQTESFTGAKKMQIMMLDNKLIAWGNQ